MRRILMVIAAVAAPNLAMAQVELRVTVPSVRVRVAPPPARVEVQPERRSPDQIWIAGHWAPRGSSTIWVDGAWTSPPQEGMVWERERWSQRDRAWYYSEGHWRWNNPPAPTAVYERQPIQSEVAVERPPPRPFVERRPPRPFRDAVWIAGYWGWDGAYHRWVAGHYSARPGHAVWTPDRWMRTRGDGRGHRSQWVLTPGRWDDRGDRGRGNRENQFNQGNRRDR